MKLILTILFLTGFFTYSQQVIEICEGESVSYTYSINSQIPMNFDWVVNGDHYLVDELTMDWSVAGTYDISVTGYSVNGDCPSDTQNYNVVVISCEEMVYWVPNTFTPDNDEFNQYFYPVITDGIDITDFTFLIFNRWGEIIWESHDTTAGWNGYYKGKKCQDGVYIWKMVFGISGSDKRIDTYGHLNLLR